eukprot:jgi/Undpi1/1448/HiC_scaffold_11.g04839.m1
MGNRLNGFQGALGLAMITDRALLVDWYGGVSGRSKQAHKYEDNFLEAYGVPHDTIPAGLEDYEHMPGTRVWCQMPNPAGLLTPCPTDTLAADFLTVASWTELYAADSQVVILQGFNHDPMTYVRDNVQSEVADAVARLDSNFHEDPFMVCSLRFLFKPKPEFKEHYCQERSTVLDGKFASVSLHLRTGDNPDYHPEWYETLPEDVEKFVGCAKGFDEGLKAVAGNSTDFDHPPAYAVRNSHFDTTDPRHPLSAPAIMNNCKSSNVGATGAPAAAAAAAAAAVGVWCVYS